MADSVEKIGVRTGLRQTTGWLLCAFAMVMMLSLLTFDWGDIRTLQTPPNPFPHNCFGPVGAWASWLMFLAFGLAAYAAPLIVVGVGLRLVLRPDTVLAHRLGWGGVFFCAILALLDLHRSALTGLCADRNIGTAAGGVLSSLVVRRLLVPAIEESGTAILAWLLLLLAGVKLLGMDAVRAGYRGVLAGVAWALGKWRESRQQAVEASPPAPVAKTAADKRRARTPEESRSEPPKPAPAPAGEEEEDEPPVASPKRPQRPEPSPVPAAVSMPTPGGPTLYNLPPLSLLDPLPPEAERRIVVDVDTTGRIIRETLREFDIETELMNAEQGPVVTRYELRPAAGVRVERIESLSNNLALALKATSLRVEAPVPGKGVVGIEVPNATSSRVYFREILEGEGWRTTTAALPLALGKDIGGEDVISDLAGMPHLLIAGATGSGKTVCMHAVLLGFLMRFSPDRLRFILVDPKIVEFSAYDKLPHLIMPVITDPKKVALGLRWAIVEMEKRYKLFARVGVRNIESFNRRQGVAGPDSSMTASEAEVAGVVPGRIPYVVIVVDELADLMLVAQADIENAIARLAQLSRAVGIHMILATQRPSVNIITGTIKANFPARIAFQVASRIDSRTILDDNGADTLLGRGDMLFLPPGSNKLVRSQGTWVTDHESRRVVDFIRQQLPSRYEVDIQQGQASAGESSLESSDEGVDDEMLEQAVEIIRETRRASTSSLQRRLRIGYTRAARLMDILEERGVVGPPRGSDPREILIDLDARMGDSSAGGEQTAPPPGT